MNKLNDFEYIIMEYLKIAGRGVTTRRIAQKTQMSWITAKKYLKELNSRGIIEIYTEGNRIRWRVREEMVEIPSLKETKEAIKKHFKPKKKKTKK